MPNWGGLDAPASLEGTPITTTQNPIEAVDASGAQPLILLVDDSDDSREMYSVYLGRQGFAIAEASTGKAAIDQAIALVPDLIVMDLSLPDMDGELAICRIRGEPKTRDIPIIVVSGHSLAGEATDSPWNLFLAKPCMPDCLVDEIRKLLKAPTTRATA